MASGGRRELAADDDQWRVSAFISALMELVLSVLLLLGAAIAFITSQLVKFFGLEPPCTYIGCSHDLLADSSKRRRHAVCRFHHSKEDCELFPDCGASWGYAKLHSEELSSTNDDTDGCLLSEREEDSSSRDLSAITSDLDVCYHHHVDEDHHGSYDSALQSDQKHPCSCFASSSLIYRKPVQPKYAKLEASIFGDNGTAEEERVPLFSTRSVSACSSHSDAEDHLEMLSTPTGNQKMPTSRKEKCLQNEILTDGDASMHSSEGVSRNYEDEHHYMLLEGEDEEIYEAPFCSSFESISRDSEAEHCYMLLEGEGEDENIPEGPSLGNLQSESEQSLLRFVAENGLESLGPSDKDSAQSKLTEDSREKTCTSACDLSSRPNALQITRALSEPLKASPMMESIMEDEMWDVWGEVHVKKDFSDYQMNTDFKQSSGKSDEAMVGGHIGRDSMVKMEDLDAPLADLLNIHCPEEKKDVGPKGLLFHMENEFMVLGNFHKTDKIREREAFEIGSEIVAAEETLVSNICGSELHRQGSCLQDVLVQEPHKRVCNDDLDKQFLEAQSIPLESQQAIVDRHSQINSNDLTKDVCSRNAADVNEVSTAADLQGTHEDVLSKKFVEEGCSILDDYRHETEGQCDGETISKASFESVIQEAMDQYLVSFRGCLTEDRVAESVSLLENIDTQQFSVGRVKEYLDVVKGNRLAEENIEKPHLKASSEKNDSSTKFEPGGVVLKDSCDGDVATSSTFIDVCEKDQSFCVKDAERGVQQQEVALPLQAMKVEQDKEEIALEEDQEEGLDALREALQAERTILAALETELENERNAAAIATSEAMAMISRLQEEKSAMQMEVTQLQRMSEEKADYDEKAMELLKEILFKREKEKHALEKEVEMYRERLLAEKFDTANKSSARNESKDLLMPSLTPVLLRRGMDEDHDFFLPEGRNDTLPSLEEFYDLGITCPPDRTSVGQSMGPQQQFGLSPQSVELKETNRSRIFHLNGQAGAALQEDKGDFVDPYIGGPDGSHGTLQELRGTSRSIFSTTEEETQFILERLWVLEEELQELRGQDGLRAQKHYQKSTEVQHLDGSPTKRRTDRSCANSCSVRCIDDGEMGGETDENGPGMCLPVHDVYEVQLAPSHSGQEVEGSDALKFSENMLEDFEASPTDISQEYMATSRQSHRPQVLSHTRRLSPPVNTHCNSALIRNQDIQCADDSHTQRLKAADGRLVTADVMQQLAVRLQALETDRELLREILESFKHRDTELNLLQDIAQHLRELRMAGYGRASAGSELEGPFSPTFEKQSFARALKKRRYCGGPGQTQMFLLQQKSI